jgi:hypothetical protein
MKKLFLFILSVSLLITGCEKKDIYLATDSNNTKIQSFRLVTDNGINVIGSMNIDNTAGVIQLTTTPGTDITHLFPSAVIPEGAIVKPALGVYTDFTNDVQFTVLAGNHKDSKVWTVKVNQ